MYSLKSKINNYFENVNLQNISDLGKNFIDIIFIYSFLILNFYIFLILLPPYSHVEYGTIIYDFTTTNMHLFDDKIFYFCNFTIFPLVTLAILNSKKKNNFIFISFCSLKIFLFFLILNSLSLIYNFYFYNQKNSFGHYNLFYIFLILELAIFMLVSQDFKRKFVSFYEKKKNTLFFVFLVFFLFSIIFYKPFIFEPINEISFLNDLKLFSKFNNIKLIFLVTLLTLTILIKFEKNIVKLKHYKNFSYLVLLIIIIFHIFFFETSFEINHHHYAPIIGPALHIFNGSGIAGVDVHSQYGYLFFILLRFLFDYLPNTFGTTGLMIRLVNLLTILSIIFVFFKLSKNKLLSILFATIFISFHLKLAAANFASFPSLFGFRNLIPIISLFFLLKSDHNKIFNINLILLVCLSSITSFEVFLYTFIPYISYTILLKLALKKYVDVFKTILFSLGFLFLFHLIINLLYFFTTNNLINYSIYFEILKSMTISRWWPVPTLNLFFLPAIYFIIYGITLIYSFQLLIKIWNKENSSQNIINFNLFFTVSTLGILMMIYYISRSLPSNLQVASIPFYILIYLYFENFIVSKKIEKRFNLISNFIIIFFVFSFSVFIGSPPDANRNGNILLKQCLNNFNNCEVNSHIKNLIYTNHNFSEDSEEYKLLNSSNKILKKFYTADEKVLFFSYYGLSAIPEIVFSENKKWYFHPISYVFSDELSLKKKNKIFNKNKDLNEGQMITILKSRNIHRLEIETIDKISKEWYLCKVDYKDEFFEIFKLSKNECKNKL